MEEFFSSSLGVLVGYLTFATALFGLVLFGIRIFIRSTNHHRVIFRRDILRVRVPKEFEDEKDQQKEIKAHLQKPFTLFSVLGGMPAQRGWKAFFFGRNDHLTFEIVLDREGLVTFYVTAPHFMKRFLEQQIHAQYPNADVEQMEDYNIFLPQGVVVGSRLQLKKSYIFPIKTFEQMDTDPLDAITNTLSQFEPHEGAVIQYVIRSAHGRWHSYSAKVASELQQGKKLKEAMGSASGSLFGEFWKLMKGSEKKEEKDTMKAQEHRLSPMQEEMIKAIEEKTSKAGFDVNINLVVSSATKDQAHAHLRRIADSFGQFAGYEYSNTFKLSSKGSKDKLVHQVIYRTFNERAGMLLNAPEMASLFHFPLQTTETPNIRWLNARRPAPPTNLPKDGLKLGEVDYRGQHFDVRIKRDDRRRHVYIMGKSGVGKTEMMKSMALQDIKNGEGVAVIDPNGDFVEDLLMNIPKERAEDVVIFDPADVERPVGLNMLEYHSDDQRDFAVQEMIAIFYKLFGSEMIGPMFEHYMRNAMLALMEDKEDGATIVEIPRMFTDPVFRKTKLAKVQNMVVKNFWVQEYEQSQRGQQSADMLSYVISKIGRFLTNDMMRNIIGQRHSGFDFLDMMNNQKIFLVNLAKGSVGEVNSKLLGLILVTKLQMAAFARVTQAKEDRKDFYLYIDEFQNFTTDSIAVILSEARKYRLDLTIAHQYIGQLIQEGGNTKIKDAVFGNAGTIAAFRIGAEDAEFLEKEFQPVFSRKDLINVDKYTANIKLLIDNTTARPFNMHTIMPPAGSRDLLRQLKELSRLKVGRDRRLVEEEIRERSRLGELGKREVAQGPDTFM